MASAESTTSNILSERIFQRFRSHFEPYVDEVGISSAVFDRQDVEVGLQKYVDLLERVAACSEPNIGLLMGETLRPADVGVLGHAMSAAPDVRAMLGVLARYLFVFAHTNTARVDVGEEDAVLTYAFPFSLPDNLRQDHEYALSLIVKFIREFTGTQFAPKLVEFQHQQPTATAEHQRIFNCPVHFSRPHNRIHFPKKQLELPLVTADQSLLSALQFCMDDRLKVRAEDIDVVSKVRHAVQSMLGHDVPTIDEVANLLGTSKRTLQRKLKQQNTVFASVVDHERFSIAQSYVHDPHYSLTDIALMLGYSELSSFSRAFRRWTGTSPKDHRRPGQLT